MQSAIFGDLAHLDGDDAVVVPAGAEFAGKRNLDRRTDFSQDAFDEGHVAQQARAAVALDDLLDRAAEIHVHGVKAEVFNDPRGVGEHGGVGAE